MKASNTANRAREGERERERERERVWSECLRGSERALVAPEEDGGRRGYFGGRGRGRTVDQEAAVLLLMLLLPPPPLL